MSKIIEWLKNLWNKDVVALVEKELSGFSTMKKNLEAHIAEAEAQFVKAEEAAVAHKKEMEAKIKEYEEKIAAEMSKQDILNKAKAKAKTIIGNIESFLGEGGDKAEETPKAA